MAKTEIKYKKLYRREGKGYEVQWYDNEGDESVVIQIETIEELAQYLSRILWGSIHGFKNNPTVWYNGKKFCSYEYTEVKNNDEV